jgi:hypothetical protein
LRQQILAKKCCLTFWLFTTFQPAYKALRSNAAGWNVGEGDVGKSEATDLADRTPSRISGASVNSPVMRGWGVLNNAFLLC